MILIGLVLLVLGFLTGYAVLWTLGILFLLIGLVLLVLGSAGRPVRGRRWYW